MNHALISIRFADWIARCGYKVDYQKNDEIFWFHYVGASHTSVGSTSEIYLKFEEIDKRVHPQDWDMWIHPEQLPGEVLLINVKDNENWETNIPKFIQSVRRGNVAYTTGGKDIVPDMKPLFGILK
jgi:hypothetical protein